MSTLQVKELQLENVSLKAEILQLRSQVTQLSMPALEAEFKRLSAEIADEKAVAQKAVQAVADKGVVVPFKE